MSHCPSHVVGDTSMADFSVLFIVADTLTVYLFGVAGLLLD